MTSCVVACRRRYVTTWLPRFIARHGPLIIINSSSSRIIALYPNGIHILTSLFHHFSFVVVILIDAVLCSSSILREYHGFCEMTSTFCMGDRRSADSLLFMLRVWATVVSLTWRRCLEWYKQNETSLSGKRKLIQLRLHKGLLVQPEPLVLLCFETVYCIIK